MAKMVDYWDPSGKKRRVTKDEYSRIMASRKKSGDAAAARSYTAQKQRDVNAGTGTAPGITKAGESVGSVGAPGSYAAHDVVGGILKPFQVPAPLRGAPGGPTGPGPDQGALDYWKSVHDAQQPDPLQALLDQLMGQIHTDVGAGPNLQDYIGAFGPARDNALKYQQAATGQINSGTQALLAKLGQLGAVTQGGINDAATAAKAQTQQVQGDQGKAALLAAQDLQKQGLSSAPLEAQQTQLGGQLQSTATNQDAFAAKLAQLQQSENADRQASAQQAGQGAVGTLGLNTNQALNQLNLAEAQARRQYGQDASQHAVQASNAKSNDLQQRMQLAQQFASLDASTQIDPTQQVRQSYRKISEIQDLFDNLDNGNLDPATARVNTRQALAKAKAVPRESQDHALIAKLTEAERAITDWEKATHPDAKKAAKEKQLATLSKYLQPH